MIERENYFTEAQVAEYLNIAVSTLRTRRCKGHPMPPGIRLGREWFYPKKEFVTWFKQQYPLQTTTLRLVG